MTLFPSVGSTRRVGEPIHEVRLTASLEGSIGRLVKPGPGRSVFVVAEAEAPIGRPDVAVVVVAQGVVSRYMNSGVRLPNVTAAKLVLTRDDSLNPAAVTDHRARVRKELERSGWTYAQARRLSSAVRDTLAVEAKVRDWRAGLRQVTRFRRDFSCSALLLPSRPASAQFDEALGMYGCGLLVEDRGRIRWDREAQRIEPPNWANLWMLELVARGLEKGTAYRATSRSKRESASE